MEDYNKKTLLYNRKVIENKKKYIENVPIESMQQQELSMAPVVENNKPSDEEGRKQIITNFLDEKIGILTNNNYDTKQYILVNLDDAQKEFLYTFWSKFQINVVDHISTTKRISKDMFLEAVKNFIDKESNNTARAVAPAPAPAGPAPAPAPAPAPPATPAKKNPYQDKIDGVNSILKQSFIDFANSFDPTPALEAEIQKEVKKEVVNVQRNIDHDSRTKLLNGIRFDLNSMQQSYRGKLHEFNSGVPDTAKSKYDKPEWAKIVQLFDPSFDPDKYSKPQLKKLVGSYLSKIVDLTLLRKVVDLLVKSNAKTLDKAINTLSQAELDELQNDAKRNDEGYLENNSYVKLLSQFDDLNDNNHVDPDLVTAYEKPIKRINLESITLVDKEIEKLENDAKALLVNHQKRYIDFQDSQYLVDVNSFIKDLNEIKKDAITYWSKATIRDMLNDRKIQSYLVNVVSSTSASSTTASTTAPGGTGIKSRSKNLVKHISNVIQLSDKLYVDMKQLKKNILNIKYIKNQNYSKTFKPIVVTNALRDLAIDTIKHGSVNEALFNKVNKDEKKLFKSFIRCLNISCSDNTEDANEDTKFQILLGEFKAGNDNPIIRKELRKYVLRAMQENQIAKNVGYQYLVELSE